jgi:uncharacterized membrane protein YidH (DUF202 family)
MSWKRASIILCAGQAIERFDPALSVDRAFVSTASSSNP